MKLSAAIMAHTKRAAEAEELQHALDRPVPIIFDKVRTPSADPRQRWRTGRRAWEEADPQADYHLVLQDDALVCRDLIAGLEQALTVLGPAGFMSAFTGKGKPEHHHIRRALDHAQVKGHAWMPTTSLCWGVAIIAPVNTVSDMLKWCSHSSKSQVNYDKRIGMYYRDVVGWRTWHTVPSLVDHREMPSLIGHGDGRRHAFAHHGGSALDIDWKRVPPQGLRPEHDDGNR